MNLLLKKFQGKFLEFVINMTTSEEFEESIKVSPLVLQAFLIDADDKFVYLGTQNPLESDGFVKIEDIRFANVVEPLSYEDVSIVDPEKDESLN